MPTRFAFRPSLSWLLLCLLLAVLWVAGGSARADVLGQPVVRGAAVMAILAVVLFDKPPNFGELRPIWLLIGAAASLTLLQLVPLPPSVWQAMPGRAILQESASLLGVPQPWRPLSMSPSATLNAAASLLVPGAVLLLLAGTKAEERQGLPGVLLVVIAASMLIGLLQFSGALLDNPFINETRGEVAGSFANRNHFALFMAIGCLVVPAWVFGGGRMAYWRLAAGSGLVILFLLSILASGSRAGLVLGPVALVIGMALAWRSVRRELRGFPTWATWAVTACFILMVGVFVGLSRAAGRAASIDRVISIDVGEDMRARAFPTIISMTKQYFPFGAGLGTFDPVFRLNEPFALLKPTYLNHAHNDLIEIVLDAGLLGGLLLAVALGWWAWAGILSWRSGRGGASLLPRLGSGVIFLILLASAVDYPARTPMMMAVLVMAGAWLCRPWSDPSGPALPRNRQHL